MTEILTENSEEYSEKATDGDHAYNVGEFASHRHRIRKALQQTRMEVRTILNNWAVPDSLKLIIVKRLGERAIESESDREGIRASEALFNISLKQAEKAIAAEYHELHGPAPRPVPPAPSLVGALLPLSGPGPRQRSPRCVLPDVPR
jgi:hypothetical protein